MTNSSGDSHPGIFTDLPPSLSKPGEAAAAILQVPYDATASWLSGAAGGPQAIIEASRYVELWDIETQSEPWLHGLALLEPLVFEGDPRELSDQVEERAGLILENGQLPIVLGGEHSVTVGAVRAAAQRTPGLSVLQIDAHGDTRSSYHGSDHNHACVMARVREVCPIVQVGIRSVDPGEVASLDEDRVFWAHEIVGRPTPEWVEQVVDRLSDDVYTTIDVDGFDPSIIPATGTPEPGGLDWYQVNGLLREVARRRRVVGFDVVELLPGHPPSAFTAAKLIYRFLAEIFRDRAKAGRSKRGGATRGAAVRDRPRRS